MNKKVDKFVVFGYMPMMTTKLAGEGGIAAAYADDQAGIEGQLRLAKEMQDLIQKQHLGEIRGILWTV